MEVAGSAFAANILSKITAIAIDFEDRVLFWSHGAERLYGYSAGEVIGQPVANYYRCEYPGGEDHRTLLNSVRQNGKWIGNCVHVLTGGRRLPVESEICLLCDDAGNEIGFSVVTRDSRARRGSESEKDAKQAEEVARQQWGQLRSSGDVLECFLENMPACVCVKDEGGRHLFDNRAAREAVDFLGALRGKTDEELFGPELGKRLREIDLAVLASNAPVRSVEVLEAEGKPRFLLVVKFPIADATGSRFVGGVSIDITESVQDREKLRQQSSLLDLSSNAILMVDLNCRITYWNRGAEQVYGYTSAEVQGKHPNDVLMADFAQPFADIWDLYLREGYWEGEFSARTKQGEPITVLSKWSLLRDAKGEPVAGMGISTDVTETKIAFAELRRAESEAAARAEELTAILDAMPAAVFIAHDRECRRMTSSRFAHELFRLPYRADSSKSAPPEEHPTFKTLRGGAEIQSDELPIQMAAKSGQPIFNAELAIAFEDGTSRDIFGHAVPLLNDRGEVRGAVGAFIDVTERNWAEEAARQNEAILRSLVDATSDFVFLKDRRGHYLMMNRAAASAVGMTPEETIGKSDYQLFPLETAERISQEDREVIASEGTQIFEREMPISGELRYLHTVKSVCRAPSGDILGVVGIARDITERKALEVALQKRERELIEAQRIARLGTWSWARKTDKAKWSDEVFCIFGRDPKLGEMSFDEIRKMHTPESRARLETAVGRALSHGESYELDFELRMPDGSTRWILDRCEVETWEDGEVASLRGTLQEITERKKNEQEMALRENRYHSLVNAAAQIVWTTNAEGNQRNRVPGWQAFTGQTDEEILGSGWADAIHPDDRDYTFRQWADCVATGKPYEIQHRLRRHDGTYRTMNVRAVPVRDTSGRIVEWVGAVSDVTESMCAQHALQEQAELLELAHDTIMMCGLDGTIRFWNHGAERMYGFSKKEAIGQISHELLRTVCSLSLAEIKAAVLREDSWEGELAHTSKDGTRIVVSSRRVLQRDKAGQPCAIMEINNDITKRKQAEEHLFEAHQRLQALMTALPVGVSFSDDATCQRITGNPAVLKQFEVAPGDNLSPSASDPTAAGRQVLYYQNGRRVTQDELPLQRSVAENREISGVELEVQLPSGRSWMAECYGAPVRDAQGNVISGVAVTVDVSGRKIAEKQILEAHQKLEHVLTSITDGFLVLDRDWRYTYSNEQGARLVGMRPEEIVGRCVWELFPHAEGPRFHEGFQRAVDSGQPVHFEELYPEPLNKWIECHCYPLEEGLSVFFRDITERKAAEEALRVSESRFRKLFQSDLLGICIPDRFGAFLEGNNEFLRIVGYTREDLEAGRVRWDIMTPPEFRDLDAAHIAEAAERGSCTPYEKEYIRKDGNRVPIACGYALLEGSRDVYIAFIQDLSPQRRAEADLREREQRFRVLAESLPEFVWIRDSAGRYVYCNQRLLDYVGHSLEWLANHAFDAVHPDDVTSTIEKWNRSSETGESYLNAYRLRRHDGVYRYFLARAVPMRDDAGGIQQWLGSTTDIHDQKLAEEALRRTEKLSAAARLAATMAHEINNPLNSVVNTIYLALADETLSESTRQLLNLADQELARSVQVATQMLRFHKQSTAPALVDLSETMDSVLALYGPRLRSRSIEVKREYLTHERLHCFNDELRHAFANLISNSLDAIGSSGRLRVRISLGRRWHGNSARGIRVTVADTGEGIPLELRKTVFEPFVSTKENTGTGLGLWVTDGIINKHHGKIALWSSTDPGRHGTVFSLFLPLRTIDG